MPIFVDLDIVVLHLLSSRTHPLVIGMLQDIFAVLRMNCVQNVEKVLPVTVLAFRKRVGHELHEIRVKTYSFQRFDTDSSS